MVRPGVVLAAIAVLGAGPSLAQPGPPLPPPRPQDAPSPAPPPASPVETPRSTPAEKGTAQAVAEPDPCLARLRAGGFEVAAADQPSTSNELCRIETPLRLKAVPVPSRPGAIVRLDDEPILACRFADAFGRWVGDLVAPVVAGALRTELKSVRTGPGFACRNRNRAETGKLSAHAEGLAIDIAGFELADGTTLRIKPDGDAPPNPALAALRTAACGWFTTVLGPGSDAAHADHLHVDVQQHGSSDRYRICQ
ncbi:extensin family protein [Microvirga vignae]|uniref:extensin-like domain-containing protein n=1 Tax=Microvirga vignae TaxID=1225564 RepID=UPI000AB8354C|nr:extensin family protein [Microvirga vignae]